MGSHEGANLGSLCASKGREELKWITYDPSARTESSCRLQQWPLEKER